MITERQDSIARICDCLQEWISNAEVVGGRGESLRCAGESIRELEIPTAVKIDALGHAVESGLITSREASEIL